MVNPTILSAKLAGLVGFRMPFNPEYQILDAANQASRSGLYITDNPFVKIESIKDSQDYNHITDADFNLFLKNKISASIVNVANAVFNEPDYIDRQVIYTHAANKFPDAVHNPSNPATYDLPPGFMAYWLQVAPSKNVAFKIKRVFLEFSGTGDITLYLFNTANLQVPLQSKTVNVTSPFQEVELDWTCDNTDAGYKGDYYLGYFTKDMTIKPYVRQYRESILMSQISQMNYWRAQFQYYTQLSDNFDLQLYSSYIPYNGVNPDILVYDDFTDMVIQNEKLFARAIQIDCQINLLTENIASLRSNRNERISAMYTAQVMAQIEGESGDGNVKVKGLRPQWFGAIGQIKKELKKLSTGYQGQGLIMVESAC